MWATQDFYGWRDEFYHGTHVAGIIAANHNDIGIDGIAPEATIVAIQATNDNRLIYPEYVTCAFMWAASHGVDIVNNRIRWIRGSTGVRPIQSRRRASRPRPVPSSTRRARGWRLLRLPVTRG